MELTHNITIDMVRKGVSPRVYAMQFDTNARSVRITMISNGEPWNAPSDSTISLSYRKPDGTRGFYNRLSDDASAVSVDGNSVTVVLAHQVLTVPGKVDAALVVNSGQQRLATFPFEIHVTADPSSGETNSDDYFNPGIVAENAVLYVPQELTKEQQEQARRNIGAAAEGTGGSGTVTAINLSNFENGTWTETVDGEVVSHTAEFDDAGRPIAIDGVTITWGDA